MSGHLTPYLTLLPNGAFPLLERNLPHRVGKNPAAIVLARSESDFVTWTLVKPPADNPFCVSGHYFEDDLRAALDDYEKRT